MSKDPSAAEGFLVYLGFWGPYVAYAAVAVCGFAIAKDYDYREVLAGVCAFLTGASIVGIGLQLRKDFGPK